MADAQKYDMILKDGKVILREYKYTKSVSLETLAKTIFEKKFFIETKQLPPNCVKYARKKLSETYYIHIPEDFYNLREEDIIYTVRLPHTIFKFSFELDSIKMIQDVQMSWTDDAKLDLTKDTFFSPIMPNVYTRNNEPLCGLCIEHPSNAQTQSQYIEKFIENFFIHSFNKDLSVGKKTIKLVSIEQKQKLKDGVKEHDLVQVWIPNDYKMVRGKI